MGETVNKNEFLNLIVYQYQKYYDRILFYQGCICWGYVHFIHSLTFCAKKEDQISFHYLPTYGTNMFADFLE